ncbi:hypothetical protein [Arenibaculum sp.]|jgi:hypothetical protein|uniref:hypothetical protein n=1 Tax=Arenibaculum sp. TaxID=2865862 RepID=UPI002E119DF4|nr:hypothetical protein [Arenibaculum sp.]
MARVDGILQRMRNNPGGIPFEDVVKVCEHYFGASRQNGTSHRIYKMPWAGDPRVNIQRGKDGKAKSYQVRQVVQAIDKLEASQASIKGEDDAE